MKALVGILVFASVLALAPKSHATGGFHCTYEENGVKFDVGGVTSRSFENDLVSLDAIVVSPRGEVKFTKGDVRQYWNHGKDLKVILYSEKDTADSYEWTRVLIETKGTDWLFKGFATIEKGSKAGNWKSKRLPITCEVE